ncbi:hypothetical protein ACFWZ2_35630 [Streptomyces sp. NPDC059002]|uniref:hypothetical protein n=1 Tax=Streptomyces sp. NPDC059002 TaxID=3346690 RepID=UPI0036C0A4AF
MHAVQKAGLALASALVGLTAAAVPGSAAAAPSSSTTAQEGSVAACKKPIDRWGHRGYYRCGSSPMNAYWDDRPGYDETFVVGPDRKIYSIWAGSGGWHELPGNGRADDMYGHDESNGRTVAVRVGTAKFCTNYKHGQWNGWHRCGSVG